MPVVTKDSPPTRRSCDPARPVGTRVEIDAVICWLLRDSGSVASSYGAL